MKIAIIFVMLSFNVLASEIFCHTDDFNPDNFEGQGLILGFENDRLVSIEKAEGSWFCDQVKITNPKIISNSTSGTVVYSSDFGCDEWDGRLVIKNAPYPQEVTYSFSWMDDDGEKKSSNHLSCDGKKE